MRIQFSYSISQTIQRRGAMQLHDQKKVVEIAGEANQHGNPSHAQLAEAERLFLEWFATDKPYSYLIAYTSGPADGSKGRFSEYRAYLPA